MLENNHMKILLAVLVFGYLLLTGPVRAGFLDMTVDSLKTEDTSGC
jgi:hypothetical protein